MAGIDRLLQHPAIEVQPGKLAIDEALGAGADRWTGLSVPFFFFNYSGLRGFHQISIHPKVNGAAAPAEAVQTMCYRDDVSMTLMFLPLARQDANRTAGLSIAQQFSRQRPAHRPAQPQGFRI